MNIDERGRRAGTDLLERASTRPIPVLAERSATASRTRRLSLVAAAAAALVVVVIGVVATRRDDSVRTITNLPTPDAVQARSWSPVGLGVTVTVPSTWVEGGPVSGFRYAVSDATRDSYVLADRLRNVERLDVDAVGSSRAGDLHSLGATGVTTAPVNLGGRRAVELRYQLPGSAGSIASVTEYDFVDGDWFFLVAVGEHTPINNNELSQWVASTIQLRALSTQDLAFPTPLGQPASPQPTPQGIEPVPWSPTGLGATMQVPSTWTDIATSVAGFDHALQPPGGGPTVMASRISAADASTRETALRSMGADIESTVDTTVDNHPARAIRYWIATPGDPLRVTLNVQYVIDAGSGDDIVVNTAELDGGDDNSALLQWVRSTIHIT